MNENASAGGTMDPG